MIKLLASRIAHESNLHGGPLHGSGPSQFVPQRVSVAVALKCSPTSRMECERESRENSSCLSFGDSCCDSFEKGFCFLDPFKLWQLTSFVLNSHVSVITVGQHDVHHLEEVGMGLITFLVEVMCLGAD